MFWDLGNVWNIQGLDKIKLKKNEKNKKKV
jgi:hypothetical protein